MITLITGQPGHGKTQWAIAQALKLVKEGRTVYAGNIRGLKYADAGFIPLDSLADWEQCPDGSVILWDECYDALPQRAPGRPVPSHIEALARHRHRGFDFLLVCQQPKQLDSFVSGLIERHIHCRRKYGTKWVRLLEWDKWERDTEKALPLMVSNWRLDPSVWTYYESATQHTGKTRVPARYYALVGLALFLAVAIYAIPTMMLDRAAGYEAQAKATHDKPDAQAAGLAWGGVDNSRKRDQVDELRKTDPLAYMRARIPGMPWTAPAYDGFPIAEPPRLYCYISHKRSKAGDCRCVTEGQNTSVYLDDELCRLTVQHGIYDPIERRSRQTQPVAAAPAPQPTRANPPTPTRTLSRPYVGRNYQPPPG